MFGLHVLTTARVAALKADGHAFAGGVGSTLTAAVSLAAQTGKPIGPATLDAIDAAEATGKTGTEKRADAIAAVAPLVLAQAAKGSVTALLADAEQFAALVLEEVLATVKKTPIVMIGEALLKVLGIN